ncbi:hypothetical protein NliqN6_6777 [Naganishia liquefaciens]|uniref:Major facilitator superfamily (MFS) profile domain-containing protein n=1 Tax=Naganishia liquefaciens TaxID=104408 RepID=A0A8H3U0N3_9TREE|nr:hypothetical protein NliqN6_6777 [Naganishia liquefaciens]
MSVDKKILLSETAHLEGSPAVRETLDDEKSPVLVIPSTPRNGSNKPQNILAHLSKEDLLSDVRNFATQRGLEEYLPDLEKGALLAQRPDEYEDIAELTEEDRAAIRYEKAHKWNHPLWLWLTIIICSTGACVQGWDQTGSNGANLSFPAEFGIASGSNSDEWLVGMVNAGPYLGSSLLGCWLSDPLNNYFGRRGAIFITALCLIATPIASGFTKNWQGLFIARLVMGLGMGAKGSTVPIFAAENAPTSIRGALVMSWQLWTAFGIFLGFAANVVVIDTGSIAWRLQLGSAFIPAVPLALGVYFCPESPRWLMKKNRYPQAMRSLLRLRHTRLQAARDMYYISAQLTEEMKIMGGETFVQRFIELFTKARTRRATLASFVVMIAQQMCGINIIAFYSSTIFVEANYSEREALYASLGFGAVNFLFAWPAVFTIDTFGRRNLLLSTFPLMCLTLLGAGLSFLIPEDSKAHIGMIAFFIFLFAAIYSVGEGPVPFTYSAECFDLQHREVGMAWAVATCFFWSAVLSLTFPSLLRDAGPVGAFGFYAGLNAIAFVMIWLAVPETKGLSLEELDAVFEVPSKAFIRYQNKQVAPYWAKRYILRQKGVALEPMVVRHSTVSPDGSMI